MQADSHQSFSQRRTHLTSSHADICTQTLRPLLPFVVFINLPGTLASRCFEVNSAVAPSVLPLSSTALLPQNPPINITEDGCVFILQIDCGYRVMVPFLCVCVSARWRALWKELKCEGGRLFPLFPEPSSRSLSVRSLILCCVEGLLPPFLPLFLFLQSHS